ncbi:MAG: hypothetical protein IJ408_04385 [Clostridia bacterium]|nr:hypothetical protein [Clostridia bacterium]
MISCTEFIPLYSELFAFLEKEGGYDAVMDYWYFIADNGVCNKNNVNSLISFLERDKASPLEGAWKYWSKSLTEEACDLFRVYDPEKGIIYSHMRHCPSRGMLNSLEHIEPYPHYCDHCKVIYHPALLEYGLDRHRDNSLTPGAECKSVIFVKGNDPGIDLATVRDEEFIRDGVQIMDIKSEDNKYLHRDFHFHGDLAMRYLGEKYGGDCVRAFVESYAKHFYAPQIEDAKARGLIAIKEWIEKIYETEEASEVLTTRLSGDTLTVRISKSPAIEYLRSTGCEVCEYYIEQTRSLYKAIADEIGAEFILEYYDENGKAEFIIRR